jgi:hypothetical protein
MKAEFHDQGQVWPSAAGEEISRRGYYPIALFLEARCQISRLGENFCYPIARLSFVTRGFCYPIARK